MKNKRPLRSHKRSLAFLILVTLTLGIITVSRLGAQDSHDHDPAGHAHEHQENEPAGDPHAGHAHDADDNDHDLPEPTKTPVQAEQVHSHDEAEHAHDQALQPQAHQIARLNLLVQPVQAGGLDAWLRVPGEIKLNLDTMAHMVPRAAGIVRTVQAELGQKVETGQVLATLESRDLAVAKAEYLALQERFTLVQTRFDREKQLHAQSISSTAEFLEAQQNLAEIRIQLRSARQNLIIFGLSVRELEPLAQQSEETFAHYYLTAPFTGTIIRKHIVLGEAVDNQTEVFEIADLSQVWIDLLVPQRDVSSVKVGQAALILLPDTGEELKGRIQYLDPIIDTTTRAAVARVIVSNPEGRYRPGLFISGRIRTRQVDQKVIVPNGSLQTVNDQLGVFVACSDGFEFRPVIKGLTDQTHTEILSGLAAGERIVTRNTFHLKAEMTMGNVDAHAGHSH